MTDRYTHVTMGCSKKVFMDTLETIALRTISEFPELGVILPPCTVEILKVIEKHCGNIQQQAMMVIFSTGLAYIADAFFNEIGNETDSPVDLEDKIRDILNNLKK